MHASQEGDEEKQGIDRSHSTGSEDSTNGEHIVEGESNKDKIDSTFFSVFLLCE